MTKVVVVLLPIGLCILSYKQLVQPTKCRSLWVRNLAVLKNLQGRDLIIVSPVCYRSNIEPLNLCTE